MTTEVRLTVEEIAERWSLRPSSVRQVVRDGWLVMVNRTVGLWQLQEMETMGMPAKWRAREASSLRPRMTPILDPVTMELPTVESVMRLHRVARSRAYKILSEMTDADR